MSDQSFTRKIVSLDSELYSQYQNCDRWAVIVGISKYQHSIINLKYADQDAESLHQLLLTPNGGSFQSDHICKLTNEQATTGNITRALRSFLKKPAREDLVLIYLAGHGSPDPDRPDDVYFLTYDTDPNDIAGTALPMEDIHRAMKSILHSEKVIILADTCHSAAIGGGIGGRRSVMDDTRLMNRFLQNISQSKGGVALLTSAEANEVSFEDSKWGGGHGVFTHYLLEGMRGAADQDADGLVTIGELFEYVRDNVKKATNYKQHPSIGQNAYDRKMPVAVAPNASFSTSVENLDVTFEIALTIEEMTAGTEKLIATEHNNITVKIPAGITTGKRIRIPGRGKLNQQNQQRGDLYLKIAQELHLGSQVHPTNGLRSEKRINYAELESLLKAGKWGEADKETVRILLQVVNRTQQGWLRPIDFSKFPCLDLQTINQLWESYSFSRFGFVVQKQLWETVRHSAEREYVIRDFCRACGSAQVRKGVIGRWSGDKILSIEEIYEYVKNLGTSETSREGLENISRGLLPAVAHWRWIEPGEGVDCLDAFFTRFDDCSL